MSGAKELLVPKEKYKEENCIQNMTVALARIPYPKRGKNE